MPKRPAFQFYPGDWLSDAKVTMLSLEEEGAYIRLLSYCWIEGSIPSDSSAIAQLCKGCSLAIAEALANLFQPHPDHPDRLIHKRLLAEKTKQDAFRKERKESGLRGAKKRWSKQKNSDSSAMQQPLANYSSSSSSSTPSSDSSTKTNRGTGIPDTEARAVEWAGMDGVPPEFAKSLFQQMESVGWLDGMKRVVVNWRQYAARRWTQEQDRNGREGTKPGKTTNGQKKLSVYELRSIRDELESEARELKNQHFSQAACGGSWDNEIAFEAHKKLRKEISDIKQKIKSWA